MNDLSNAQAISQILGLIVAAIVAGWVRFDAQKRGFKPLTAIGWSVGVLMALIIFLPAYLWVRRSHPLLAPGAKNAAGPIAGVPCPYCGYTNAGNADYCGKCGRQMRSSTEIHR